MKNNQSNNNENYPMIDERQRRSIGDVSTIIVIVTILYLLVEITYKYVTTKDILTTRGSPSEGTTRGNLIFLDTVYKGFSLI